MARTLDTRSRYGGTLVRGGGRNTIIKYPDTHSEGPAASLVISWLPQKRVVNDRVDSATLASFTGRPQDGAPMKAELLYLKPLCERTGKVAQWKHLNY